MIQEMRLTMRRLLRTPVFTVAVVVTLALGIGANTAIFSVIHGVLLKPLPFVEPERLIGVWQTAPGVNIADLNASIADYITYREESKTFADVALWNGRSVTVTEFADPERVEGIQATFRLLPMLGIQPVVGRGLVEKDSETGSADVVPTICRQHHILISPICISDSTVMPVSDLGIHLEFLISMFVD